MAGSEFQVAPPPVSPRRRGRTLPFLGIWGFLVLCAGAVGSIASGAGAFWVKAREGMFAIEYGSGWDTTPQAVALAFQFRMQLAFLIAWLVVSCMGGILYRYARSPL